MIEIRDTGGTDITTFVCRGCQRSLSIVNLGGEHLNFSMPITTAQQCHHCGHTNTITLSSSVSVVGEIGAPIAQVEYEPYGSSPYGSPYASYTYGSDYVQQYARRDAANDPVKIDQPDEPADEPKKKKKPSYGESAWEDMTWSTHSGTFPKHFTGIPVESIGDEEEEVMKESEDDINNLF